MANRTSKQSPDHAIADESDILATTDNGHATAAQATGTTPAGAGAGGVLDPFAGLSAEDLAVDQDFVDRAKVEKKVTLITVDRPGNADWIRVHPTFVYSTILLDVQGKLYMVGTAVREELAKDPAARLYTLVPAVTSLRKYYLWPIKVGSGNGREPNTWNESALAAAQLAREEWVRVYSDRPTNQYKATSSAANLLPPDWPSDLPTMWDYIKLGFRDRLINSTDHPIYVYLTTGGP
jgi:hypothetical protein